MGAHVYVPPTLPSRDQLLLVHDPSYVQGAFLSGTLDAQRKRRIGEWVTWAWKWVAGGWVGEMRHQQSASRGSNRALWPKGRVQHSLCSLPYC
jgi:hypothetical protein